MFEYRNCPYDATVCKCKFGHVFGKILRDVPFKKNPIVKVDLKNVLYPGSRDSVKVFTGEESQITYQKGRDSMDESELLEINERRSKIKKFECVICHEIIRKKQEEGEDENEKTKRENNFWERIGQHLRSLNHDKNAAKFIQ